jgi:hypothetical protein
MQTARRIAIVILAGGLIATAHAQLQAEDLAASDELPAAIQALGLSGSDFVTKVEAKRVRGKFFVSEGVIGQFAGVGAYPKSALAVSGVMGGRDVTFVADVDGIRIALRFHHAVGTFRFVSPPRPERASLEIIALPGTFLANFE